MFKKYLFCMYYFVEYEINISFYFHKFFFFCFKLWPPLDMNPGSVPGYKPTILLNIINITTYFENLIIGLHVLYALNIHVKFYDNQILFSI